jgi:hypothetical protein
MAADTFGDVVAERADLGGEALARLDLHERQLGVAMELLEQRAEMIAVVGRDVVAQRGIGRMRIDSGSERYPRDCNCDFVHGDLFLVDLAATLLQLRVPSSGSRARLRDVPVRAAQASIYR